MPLCSYFARRQLFQIRIFGYHSHFLYIFGDYLNWGNTSCKVNGIFNRLVERKSLILSYEIDFMIIESGLSLQWQKHAGDFVTSDPFYCWEVTKMALDCIRNSCNMIMTSHIQLSVGKGCPLYQSFSFLTLLKTPLAPPLYVEQLVENCRPLRGHLLDYYEFCSSFWRWV